MLCLVTWNLRNFKVQTRWWCGYSHVHRGVGWVVSLYLFVRAISGPQVRDVEVSINSTLFLYIGVKFARFNHHFTFKSLSRWILWNVERPRIVGIYTDSLISRKGGEDLFKVSSHRLSCSLENQFSVSTKSIPALLNSSTSPLWPPSLLAWAPTERKKGQRSCFQHSRQDHADCVKLSK